MAHPIKVGMVVVVVVSVDIIVAVVVIVSVDIVVFGVGVVTFYITYHITFLYKGTCLSLSFSRFFLSEPVFIR